MDRLFGGQRNDFLAGQAGPDFLFGGAGSDKLVGGAGIDTCYQGTGHGPLVRCELLKIVTPPPAPTPDPGPRLHDLTGILAIAYSDPDGPDGPDGSSTGDVLISKVMGSDDSGDPSHGDIIRMGKCPTTTSPTMLSGFEDWADKRHIVTALAAGPASQGGGMDRRGRRHGVVGSH